MKTLKIIILLLFALGIGISIFGASLSFIKGDINEGFQGIVLFLVTGALFLDTLFTKYQR